MMLSGSGRRIRINPPQHHQQGGEVRVVAAVRWKLTLGWSTPYPSTTRPLPASNRAVSGWAIVPTRAGEAVAGI